MNRQPVGLYVIAVLELVAGFLLSWGGIQLIRQIAREGHPRADDLFAASALAPPGICILLAAIAAILVKHLPRGVVRGARIAALTSEVWMMLAGAGIYWVAKRHGGDWAGIGYLAGTIFVGMAGCLLLLTWLGFRFLRRVEKAAKLSGEIQPQ